MTATKQHDPSAVTVSYVRRGREVYVVMVDDSYKNLGEALRTLGRWASDPELSFTWDNAAAMSLGLRGGK